MKLPQSQFCSFLAIATVGALLSLSSVQSNAQISLSSGFTIDHANNLITNGSFEDFPVGISYANWATGSNGTHYGATPLPFAKPTAWNTQGGPGNYALWSNSAILSTALGGAPTSAGQYYLYFGNAFASAISQTPTFNADGSVVFSASPTITPSTPAFSPPVTLDQTVSGLTVGDTYQLSFWTTGEDALGTAYNHDGIFGLDVTGYDTQYLAAPDGPGVSVFNSAEHTYELSFVATDANTNIRFTNWGHFGGGTAGWTLGGNTTELMLDDVVLNHVSNTSPNATPEPGSLALLVCSGATLAGFAIKRKNRK